jgi:hypothetical protein
MLSVVLPAAVIAGAASVAVARGDSSNTHSVVYRSTDVAADGANDAKSEPEHMSVGSVVGEGRLVDGNCKFDKPVGVNVRVGPGGEALDVAWRVDAECRAVITSIEPARADDPATSATRPPDGVTVPMERGKASLSPP